MKLYKNIRNFLLLILLFSMLEGKAEDAFVTKSHSNDSSQKIKENIIYKLVCNGFIDEIYKYEQDRNKKEFNAYHIYFRDWPHQFDKLIDPTFYPLYKSIVNNDLKAYKIYDLPSDFNSWAPPTLAALPCLPDIQHWMGLKNEWAIIRPSLPVNFFHNPSLVEIFFQELPGKVEKGFYLSLFYLLLFCALYANGRFIKNLFIERKIKGLWTFALTPILSIFFERYISLAYLEDYGKYEKILLISCGLMLTTLIAVILIKKSSNYFTRYERRNELKNFKNSEISDIFEAINLGNNVKVEELINDKHELIESINMDGWTPLHVVAAQGVDTKKEHVEIAEFLLSHGSDPDSKSPLGWTPLHLIAINGADESIPILKILINYNANPFSTADDGITNWRILWQHGNGVYEALEHYEKTFIHGR